MNDGPLVGRTVVVTRPVEQAPALVALLEAEGASTVVMPLIELVDVADAAAVADAVAALGADDWVVVASAHAASRVRDALASSPARVAAVGRTTAAALPRTEHLSPSFPTSFEIRGMRAGLRRFPRRDVHRTRNSPANPA